MGIWCFLLFQLFSVYFKISYKVVENINKENKISANSSKMISPFLKCLFFLFYSVH